MWPSAHTHTHMHRHTLSHTYTAWPCLYTHTHTRQNEASRLSRTARRWLTCFVRRYLHLPFCSSSFWQPLSLLYVTQTHRYHEKNNQLFPFSSRLPSTPLTVSRCVFVSHLCHGCGPVLSLAVKCPQGLLAGPCSDFLCLRLHRLPLFPTPTQWQGRDLCSSGPRAAAIRTYVESTLGHTQGDRAQDTRSQRQRSLTCKQFFTQEFHPRRKELICCCKRVQGCRSVFICLSAGLCVCVCVCVWEGDRAQKKM